MDWMKNCNPLGILNVAQCKICNTHIAKVEVISHIKECSINNLDNINHKKETGFYYIFCYILGFMEEFNIDSRVDPQCLNHKTFAYSLYLYIYASRIGVGHLILGPLDDITRLALTDISNFNSSLLNIFPCLDYKEMELLFPRFNYKILFNQKQLERLGLVEDTEEDV